MRGLQRCFNHFLMVLCGVGSWGGLVYHKWIRLLVTGVIDEIACCCVNILKCVIGVIFISCLSLVFLLHSLKETCLSRGCMMVSEAIGYIGCQRTHQRLSQSLPNFSSQWHHYHYTPITLPAFLKLHCS